MVPQSVPLSRSTMTQRFRRCCGPFPLKRNKWLRYFAIFCRVALALGFIPSGIVKVRGERFTALPSNHPLGHYFEALHLTGYYYTFLAVCHLMTALLLIIPTTLLRHQTF